MSGKLDWIDEELVLLKNQGLYKTIRIIGSANNAQIIVDGKKVLNFCSNNYLGLASFPRIKKAAKKAIDKYGVGPGAVRPISGNMLLHEELEKELAKFKKAEGCILFQTGYVANTATIPVLVGEEDVIFSDELNHASIIDGCRLSKATVVRFRHNNPEDLKKLVKENKNFRRKLIITDGVFSMDGDIAQLNELVKVAQNFGCMLMVDDSHGEGVLGSHGRGIVDHFKLHGKVDIELGTLSKAFGVAGGFITGKKKLIELLRQKARPFLFSTGMSIPDAAACLEAVKILEKSDIFVKKLWENTKYFKLRMVKLGFDTGKSQTPITPIMLKEEKLTQEFSKKLFQKGVLATAIVYPTVAKGAARIRVMPSAIHSKDDLDKAINTFKEVGKELKVI
jgi:glycine C-acetyltransferase